MGGGKKRRERVERAKKHAEYLREKEGNEGKAPSACQEKEEVSISRDHNRVRVVTG